MIKDTESAIKCKLINLLSVLRGFKFQFQSLKRQKLKIKQSMTLVIKTQKQK